MKFSEIIEQAGVEEDSKARRVSNVSERPANITADEIEDGVTIERLEDIGVPVFKYTTQITIHGRLPEFSETARPGGYKSIVRNQNGSMGVRYVAIDGAKKATIVSASRLTENRDWHATINSKGLSITRYFAEKADCLAAYRAFPRELFAGSVMAAAGMFGGYYVVADIGAIYRTDLWKLIGTLWGIGSEEEFNALTKARDDKWATEREESARKQEEYRQENEATRESIAAELGKTLRPMAALPAKGECAFVRATPNGARMIVLAKRGPALCYQVRKYTPGMKPFEPVGKMKRFDASSRESVNASAAKGHVFHP